MFSVQSLLVGNGTSVTCLRKSREPITVLNVATYVTPLMVRNFWLWEEEQEEEEEEEEKEEEEEEEEYDRTNNSAV